MIEDSGQGESRANVVVLEGADSLNARIAAANPVPHKKSDGKPADDNSVVPCPACGNLNHAVLDEVSNEIFVICCEGRRVLDL